MFTGGCSWGNPKDSVWEDWGTLGKIRGITPPPLKNPIKWCTTDFTVVTISPTEGNDECI